MDGALSSPLMSSSVCVKMNVMDMMAYLHVRVHELENCHVSLIIHVCVCVCVKDLNQAALHEITVIHGDHLRAEVIKNIIRHRRNRIIIS